jgi:hypothetical protein
MKKKPDFFDVRGTIKSYPDAQYYIFFGERSNGKTYSSLDLCLEYYHKTHHQFAYIRRWGEDIKKKNLSELFAGHIANGRVEKWTDGEYNHIDYGSNRFFLSNIDESGEKVQSTEPIGFAFDLNSMEHTKSISFPKVDLIIFDEFLSRNGYLPNEWILFTNTLSTIIRHRSNVKIIMLGNTVNKYCPYFQEMGLTHVKDQKPGTVEVYRYAGTDLQVVCEYTPSSAKKGGKESDVYFAFDNPQLKMITGGDWEIAIYPHLTSKILPKEHVADFFIDFNDELLHGEVICKDDGAFCFIHQKTTPIKDTDHDIVYTSVPSEKWNYRMCLTKHSDKLSLFILKCLRENRIFYSTNEVGEIFRNYIMWSDSFSIKN